MNKKEIDKELEFSIETKDKEYADQVLLALYRQRYCVCSWISNVSGRDLIEITKE